MPGKKDAKKADKKEFTAVTPADIKVKTIKWRNEDETRILFDLTLYNAITVYGMTFLSGTRKDGSDYSFCNFPQVAGKKKGEYFNTCFFTISDEVEAEIEKQLDEML